MSLERLSQSRSRSHSSMPRRCASFCKVVCSSSLGTPCDAMYYLLLLVRVELAKHNVCVSCRPRMVPGAAGCIRAFDGTKGTFVERGQLQLSTPPVGLVYKQYAKSCIFSLHMRAICKKVAYFACSAPLLELAAHCCFGQPSAS